MEEILTLPRGGRGTFYIYRLVVGSEEYIGRTKNLDRRYIEHSRKWDILKIEKLGEYLDISVEGWGKLSPRMEYLWYKRLYPKLNKTVPGIKYFSRDEKRHEKVYNSYEGFERVYRVSDLA
jgi:hypothetical protein